MDTYVIHLASGETRVFSAAELIQNAKDQQAAGVEPIYRFNYGKGETSAAGYLVYSTYHDGCAIVILDGRERILTGWQGDFCISLDSGETAPDQQSTECACEQAAAAHEAPLQSPMSMAIDLA